MQLLCFLSCERRNCEDLDTPSLFSTSVDLNGKKENYALPITDDARRKAFCVSRPLSFINIRKVPRKVLITEGELLLHKYIINA